MTCAYFSNGLVQPPTSPTCHCKFNRTVLCHYSEKKNTKHVTVKRERDYPFHVFDFYNKKLGGGFKDVFFLTLPGEMI